MTFVSTRAPLTAADCYTEISNLVHSSTELLAPLAFLCAEYTLQKPEDIARYGTFSDLPAHEQALLTTATTLDCRGNTQLTWAHVQTLGPLVPQLRRLDLRNCAQLQATSLDEKSSTLLGSDTAPRHHITIAFLFHQCVVVHLFDRLEVRFSTATKRATAASVQRQQTQPKDDTCRGEFLLADSEPIVERNPLLRGGVVRFFNRAINGAFDLSVLAPFRLQLPALSYTAFSMLQGTFVATPTPDATVEEITDGVALLSAS